MQGRAGSIEKERYERIYAKPGRTWRRVITKVVEVRRCCLSLQCARDHSCSTFFNHHRKKREFFISYSVSTMRVMFTLPSCVL
jgi:hypothetical protein